MKKSGLDSSESWVIAAASIVVNFLILAPARLSGVLFVQFMDRYNIGRKQASVPFTVCYTMRTLPGPLTGYLGERFGLRGMSILGCVLATFGVGACYLAEDIVIVTIFLGVCYGLGYGFVCSLVPEFLNQYFDKHLAKANGLTMGGAGLGAFLIPPIIEVLINVYGVSGMLLIFGGVVFHSVPATMLLRKADFTKKPPPLIEVAENSSRDIHIYQNYYLTRREVHSSNVFTITPSIETDEKLKENTTCNFSKILEQNLLKYYKLPLSNDESKSMFEDSIINPYFVQPSENVVTQNANNLSSDHTTIEKNCPTLQKNSHENKRLKEAGVISSLSEENKNHLQDFNHKQPAAPDTPLLLAIREIRNSFGTIDCTLKEAEELEDKLFDSTFRKPKQKSALHSFRVFVDPVFLLITITQSSYFFMMFLIWTIIVDFVRDKGIPSNEEVYFVMCLSLSDTLGRLGLGFVTDSGYLTKANYSALCFLCMGLSCLILPFTEGFAMILCAVFVYGFISGGIMIIFPGMVKQFIDSDLRTMAMASRTILNAPMSLTLSPFIGYFREDVGTYDWIFYIVTTVSIMCGVISWLTPIVAALRDKRRGKVKQTTVYHIQHCI